MIRGIPTLVPAGDTLDVLATGEIPTLDGTRTLRLDSREGAMEAAGYAARMLIESNRLWGNIEDLRSAKIPPPRDVVALAVQADLLHAQLLRLVADLYERHFLTLGDLPPWMVRNRIGFDRFTVVIARNERAPDETQEVRNPAGFSEYLNEYRGVYQISPVTVPGQLRAVSDILEGLSLRLAAREGIHEVQDPQRTMGAAPVAVAAVVGVVRIAVWVIVAAAAAAAAYGAYKVVTDPAGVVRFSARALRMLGMTNQCIEDALALPDLAASKAAVVSCARDAASDVVQGGMQRLAGALAKPATIAAVVLVTALLLRSREGTTQRVVDVPYR